MATSKGVSREEQLLLDRVRTLPVFFAAYPGATGFFSALVFAPRISGQRQCPSTGICRSKMAAEVENGTSTLSAITSPQGGSYLPQESQRYILVAPPKVRLNDADESDEE